MWFYNKIKKKNFNSWEILQYFLFCQIKKLHVGKKKKKRINNLNSMWPSFQWQLVVYYIFWPHFFFLFFSDDFDDLWMNQHEFYECTYLIQAFFDGGSLGQLPHYITSTQLIQTFTKCTVFVIISVHNLTKTMPAVKQEFQLHMSDLTAPWQSTLMVIRLSVCIQSNCPEYRTSQFSSLYACGALKCVSFPTSHCQEAESKMQWLK